MSDWAMLVWGVLAFCAGAAAHSSYEKSKNAPPPFNTVGRFVVIAPTEKVVYRIDTATGDILRCDALGQISFCKPVVAP